jgi:flagellar motor switch protein FliG
MDALTLTRSDRLQKLAEFISTEENIPALSLETLLDTFIAVYTDCKLATNRTEPISNFIEKCKRKTEIDAHIIKRIESSRINRNDFEIIKTLATGAVGTVNLVRSKHNGQVYAMKVLKKQDLLTRQEVFIC